MKQTAPDGQSVHASSPAELSRTLPQKREAPATFVLDHTGRVTVWSPAAEALFGLAAAEVLGRRYSALLPTESASSVFPGWWEQAQSRAGDGKPYSFVLPVRCGDHPRFKAVDCSPVSGGSGKPGLLCQVSDLTPESKQPEAQTAFVECVMKASPFGLGMLDNELRYVIVNEALAKLNGVPAEDHIGRRMSEVVWMSDGGAYEKLLYEVLATGQPVNSMLISGRTEGYPDQDRAWSVSFFRVTGEEGQILGLGGMAVDITDKQTVLLEASAVRQRLALVNKASSQIGTTLEIPQTARELTEVAVPEFADAVAVEIRKDLSGGPKLPFPGEELRMQRVAARNVLPDSPLNRLNKKDSDVVHPVGSMVYEAVCAGRTIHVENLDNEILAEITPDETYAKVLRESRIGSVIKVPLSARGRRLGVVHFGRSVDRAPLRREDVKVAEELAARAAMCLDNALMYGSERRIAVELQRSMLPGDDDIPMRVGLEIAYHYRPSSSSAQVGGDWFDVIPLSGHRVALVIGDMMGHDIKAAANMGQLRTAMRTLARLDLDPATLLARLDDVMQRDATIPYATCVYAVCDTVTRECSIAAAGHPPPILRHPDGTTELLGIEPGVPLGVGMDDPEFQVTDLVLPDDSALILYTDGLIERRGEDIDVGIDALQAALAGPMPSPQEFCRDLVAKLRRNTDEDDLAVLMARMPAMPDHRWARWKLPCEPESASRARKLACQILCDWGLGELTEITVLLVSELVTNALLYSRGEMELRFAKGTTLLVEIADADERTPRRCNADADDERGRGLALVSELSRAWGTRRTPDGKIVWCEVAEINASTTCVTGR